MEAPIPFTPNDCIEKPNIFINYLDNPIKILKIKAKNIF